MVGTSSGGLEKRLNIVLTADSKQARSELKIATRAVNDYKKAVTKASAAAVRNTVKISSSVKEIRQTGRRITTSISSTFDAANKKIGQSTSVVKDFRTKFNFAFLSTMFFGMQLQRTFGGIAKSAINSFKEIAGATHPISVAFSRLDANVNFLKFAMVDAFGPALINRLSDFTAIIGSLDPEKLKGIGKAVINLTVTGAAMFAFSQIALFAQGVKSLATSSGLFITELLQRKFPKMKIIGPGRLFAGTIGLVIAGKAILDFKDILTDDQTTILKRLGTILASALGGTLIGAAVGGLPGAGIGLIIGLSIGLLVNIADIMLESGSKFDIARIKTLEENILDRLKEGISLEKIAAELGGSVGFSRSFNKVLSEFNVLIEDGKEDFKDFNFETEDFVSNTEDFVNKSVLRRDEADELANSLFRLAKANAEVNRVEQENATSTDFSLNEINAGG